MNKGSEDILGALGVGAGIGFLNVLSFLSAKRGLGVSTAFESFAAKTQRRLAPDITQVNAYMKEREEVPKTDWGSLLVLGIPLGSFFAARAGSQRPADLSYDSTPPRGPMAAFLGGMIMMFGARMAKGCTSGHGITGTSQLALSSWIFTPLMFATAAITARVLKQKEIL